jgi:hypothetical protein
MRMQNRIGVLKPGGGAKLNNDSAARVRAAQMQRIFVRGVLCGCCDADAREAAPNWLHCRIFIPLDDGPRAAVNALRPCR